MPSSSSKQCRLQIQKNAAGELEEGGTMIPWPKRVSNLDGAIMLWFDTVSVSSSSPSSTPLTSIVLKQIVIGAIIENTPAERDGRLRPGDELISVDKNVVAGKPHKYVIDLMHAAARNGQVSLTVRRRVQMPGKDMLFWFGCFCLFHSLLRMENTLHISRP